MIEQIKITLEKLNFPKRFISNQTAICILAMMDRAERKGLLKGHKSLSDGARIHDILNFARHTLDKKVAENTREAYRKTSLSPLMNRGIIVRHQLSTNDPNTYYRLHPAYATLFAEKELTTINRLISQLNVQTMKGRKKAGRIKQTKKEIPVKIDVKQTFLLSQGEHNQLEKEVVERFGYAFLKEPQVVYLGDTAPRQGYQNRTIMRRLNLAVDTTASLPDVILYSEPEFRLVIVEAVTSSGPINPIRLEQLRKFSKGPRKLDMKISFISAFPSRSVFRRFVEDIAWGSSVWIENEPNNIVHFAEVPKNG
jgi:hypothetical protein